jgi:hypothetical protein
MRFEIVDCGVRKAQSKGHRAKSQDISKFEFRNYLIWLLVIYILGNLDTLVHFRHLT